MSVRILVLLVLWSLSAETCAAAERILTLVIRRSASARHGNRTPGEAGCSRPDHPEGRVLRPRDEVPRGATSRLDWGCADARNRYDRSAGKRWVCVANSERIGAEGIRRRGRGLDRRGGSRRTLAKSSRSRVQRRTILLGLGKSGALRHRQGAMAVFAGRSVRR